MPDMLFKAAYVAGIVAEMAIRAAINRRRRRDTIVRRLAGRSEAIVLGMFFLGTVILPALYIVTPWLDFASYNLPFWLGLVGIPILLCSLYLFWRSHSDLGRNWSPTLEIREGHTLVTEGIYRHIRHPMYASQWLFVVAQALFLQNWLAGVGGILCFLPLYFIRMPREEQMMLETFGDEYREYIGRTGRVVPRLRIRGNRAISAE